MPLTPLRLHLTRQAFAALILASPALADPSQASLESRARAERLALLTDSRIDESSGLCLSRRTHGWLWTLNDSGGPTTLFALDREGRTQAEIHLKGALNLDWEDLASGPGHAGQPALFVADIGDNLQIRPHVTIYEVPEPALSTDSGEPAKLTLRPSRVWRVCYSGGPANAETLLCHPHTGQLFILTKTSEGEAELHALPPVHQARKIQRTHLLARLQFPDLPKPGKRSFDNRMTTGGGWSCDGTRLVIATYSSLYEWTLHGAQLTADALSRPPVRIDPPLTRQMEAVCYESGSPNLLFTSEQLPAPLFRIRRANP